MIIATIHGDEAAGTPLTHRLHRHLLANPGLVDGRRVVLIPVANPDGLHRRRRTNVHGIDLNRNFPASNFRTTRRHGKKPLSEPEAQALQRMILRYAPSRIVSIHQPVSCIDWDGPGEKLARAMAETCSLKAKRIGSRPGSLGSWVGLELKKPIITLELPRSADRLTEDQLWRRYGRMMVQAVVFPDLAP
jgi:protein MpaA